MSTSYQITPALLDDQSLQSVKVADVRAASSMHKSLQKVGLNKKLIIKLKDNTQWAWYKYNSKVGFYLYS